MEELRKLFEENFVYEAGGDFYVEGTSNDMWAWITKYFTPKAIPLDAVVKPACGKCIDCKFYIDMDYQKDIQNACSNGNIVFGYIPMEADKFGCIYFESKSV